MVRKHSRAGIIILIIEQQLACNRRLPDGIMIIRTCWLTLKVGHIVRIGFGCRKSQQHKKFLLYRPIDYKKRIWQNTQILLY